MGCTLVKGDKGKDSQLKSGAVQSQDGVESLVWFEPMPAPKENVAPGKKDENAPVAKDDDAVCVYRSTKPVESGMATDEEILERHELELQLFVVEYQKQKTHFELPIRYSGLRKRVSELRELAEADA
jgi:hypothetical protein